MVTKHRIIQDNSKFNNKEDTSYELNGNSIFLIIFIALIGYTLIVILGKSEADNIWNFLTYFASLILFVYALWDLSVHGTTVANLFLLSFYIFLTLNCFLLSALQKPKTITDVYYFFFGPLIFFRLLKALDGKRILTGIPRLRISYDFICCFFLIFFLLLYFFIFRTKGIRIFSTTLKSQQAKLYVIPGISGWIDLLGWLVLMLSYKAKNRTLRFLMYFIPPTFTFLNASRTLTMRMVAYLICLFLYRKGRRAASKKTIFRIIIIFVVLVILFGLWGNYRETVSRFTKKTITDLSAGYVKNDIFNWLYSYSALNYDVLKQTVIERSFPMQFTRFFLPIIRLVGGSNAVLKLQYERAYDVGSLSGFNASTFMSNTIYEMNFLYFVQLGLLAFIVAAFSNLSKSQDFHGGYIYFLMASVMSPFGNFYIDINGLYAVVLGIIICILVHPVEEQVIRQEQRKQVL